MSQSSVGAEKKIQENSNSWNIPRSPGHPRRGLAVGGPGRRQRAAGEGHGDPGLVRGQPALRRLRHLGHQCQEPL